MIGKSAISNLSAAALCAVFAVTVAERNALAQEVSSGTSVAAQALFDEAKRLIQHGDAAAACPKFEESQRLEPGVGTKLNLANCYEQIGRTASAWILFLEVESDTKRNGQTERQTMAHNRAAALQPKLSQIKIDVPATSRLPELTIARDGVQVGAVQWGLSIPVDPGIHTVQVSAPGKKAWQVEVTVAADASIQTLSVPVLENAPVVGIAAPPGTEKPRSHGQRTAAYVSFGVSGVGAVLGTVFGLRAISKNNQSNDPSLCDANNDCVPSGTSKRNDARSAGTVSTVAFVVSGAALATGVVLLLTDKKREPTSTAQLSAGAFATPNGAEFSVRGAW